MIALSRRLIKSKFFNVAVFLVFIAASLSVCFFTACIYDFMIMVLIADIVSDILMSDSYSVGVMCDYAASSTVALCVCMFLLCMLIAEFVTDSLTLEERD